MDTSFNPNPDNFTLLFDGNPVADIISYWDFGTDNLIIEAPLGTPEPTTVSTSYLGDDQYMKCANGKPVRAWTNQVHASV